MKAGHGREGLGKKLVQYFYGINELVNALCVDGEECPIDLWWPGLSEEDEMYKKGYIPISDFDDKTMCVSGQLSLSRRDFISNTSKCLTSFNWRGSNTKKIILKCMTL